MPRYSKLDPFKAYIQQRIQAAHPDWIYSGHVSGDTGTGLPGQDTDVEQLYGLFETMSKARSSSAF